MAQILSSGTCTSRTGGLFEPVVRGPYPRLLFFQRKCRPRACRVSCFFSNNRKKEEARKALENAFSEKKDEFEEWNKQIEKRGQGREGGGGTGRGGWFGGGGWYSWFGGNEFWEEAPKALIVILGIGSLYLLLTKGEAISAVIFDVLQKIRETFGCLFSNTHQSGQLPVQAPVSEIAKSSYQTPTSAKERVVRKWAMD